MAEQMRVMQDLNRATLFASDFDGTQAMTFEAAGGIIGVNQAYEQAVQKVFGLGALTVYRAQGGHLNRTPGELVTELVPHSTRPSIFETVTKQTEAGEPATSIVKNLGEPEAEDVPQREELSAEEFAAVTEVFTAAKLQPLLEQIGQALPDGERWPRPVPGFLDFWRQLIDARRDGRLVGTAILSAGHTGFIRRTYEMWDTSEPDIFITSDTMVERGLSLEYTPEQLAKPEPLIMELAQAEWLNSFGLGIVFPGHSNLIRNLAKRTIYVGDDLAKDGGLAANAGVAFVHIDPARPQAGWSQTAEKLGLESMAVHD